MNNENDGEERRRRISGALTRFGDEPAIPRCDRETARLVDLEYREREIKRRLHRELSDDDGARGGIADMVAFVDSVQRGFVPERALIRSIAARFEAVLEDTTTLYDWTTRHRPFHTPRQDMSDETIARLLPRTQSKETGKAFIEAFDMKRRRGNQHRTAEEEESLADVDRRYWMFKQHAPDDVDRMVFAKIANQDRNRRIDRLADEEIRRAFENPGGIASGNVSMWADALTYATEALMAMRDGDAAPDAPMNEPQRRGWEMACEARSKAERQEPAINYEAMKALEDAWRNWRKTQELPTLAERLSVSKELEVSQKGCLAQTLPRDGEIEDS